MMKLNALPLSLVIGAALATNALRVPFQKAKRTSIQRRSGGAAFSISHPSSLANKSVLAAASTPDDSDALSLTTVRDLLYIANITVGGSQYSVQLDTGSSDLWIQGSTTPLPNSKPTSATYNLTYGIGWAYGHISYAPAEFAGISVPSQAFLDVSSAQNPALSYGANGVLGLGFTSLSTIDSLVNATGASTGRSLLYNLFADNPKEPNFIAFSLESSLDSEDTVQGSFSIGEYDPLYTQVENTNPILTWPVQLPSRWDVLLEAVIVGGKTVTPQSTVQGAPANKAVALLDSGTSYTYAPKEICDAIYSTVPGAQFDNNSGQWDVPCSAEIDLALQFSGQVYPLHPLDVTPVSLSDPSTCQGSFVPQTVSVGAGEFDVLIGDNFLRSVYSVYDFGDFDSSGNMGNPYVKLLSIIDPNQASKEFHDVRGGTPQGNITYNASNNTGSSGSGSDGGGATTPVTLSSDAANTLDKIGKYFPAMLAVIAVNALVLVALIVLGVVFLCRGRRGGAKPRKQRGRMSPMPMSRTASNVPDLAMQPPSHVYQPVSMAMTEDTFVPPSPHFRYEGDTLKGSERPKSMA